VLKEAHVGNAQVQARMYATYRREYENFTHLPGESIDALFQRFMVVENNMRANVDVLPYDDHDRAVRDSPRGPLKQQGNPHLKPATKPKPSTPLLTMQDTAHAAETPTAH
jgi:hypothetical protein